jgi:arsenate reductase
MKLYELKDTLEKNGSALVRFRLPDGTLVAPHAHITEVGLVTKRFVDCGGTPRSETKCQLQSWVADDVDHRLAASKLLGIIQKGGEILGSDEIPVEVEHDIGYATQFQIASGELSGAELIFQLAGRHTACLAPDKCCPPPKDATVVSFGRRTSKATKQRVLFVCIHNSARSQMAEALLRHLAAERFEVESAGLEPGKLNPFAIKVMEEMNVNMSGHYAKGVTETAASGRHFDFVIAVCDQEAAEKCPIFPGGGERLHWNFPDPSALAGTDEEKLARTREIRDLIKATILDWLQGSQNT